MLLSGSYIVLLAGTRFNSRGVNDDGNVANYCETEQILVLNGHIISLVILRGTDHPFKRMTHHTLGSVPLFWEQRLIKGRHEPELSRTKEASVPAFNKHISMVVQGTSAFDFMSLTRIFRMETTSCC